MNKILMCSLEFISYAVIIRNYCDPQALTHKFSGRTERVVEIINTLNFLFLVYLYYLFNWTSLAEGLSIFQNNLNSIEFPYPKNDVSNKIPCISNFCRSKTIIIPFIVSQIGLICILIGNTMLNILACMLVENTILIKNYIIGQAVVIHLSFMLMLIPWYSFHIIYVDISHLFLSWSD